MVIIFVVSDFSLFSFAFHFYFILIISFYLILVFLCLVWSDKPMSFEGCYNVSEILSSGVGYV